MADEPTSMQISVERAPEGAQPFIPAADGRQVEFTLEPEPVSEEALAPFVPWVSKWKPPPLVASMRRALLVDIETTGLMPWDSRLMVIGVKDLTNPGSKGIVFYDEDEEVTLRLFIEFFKEGEYDEIVAYNLPFDMRYIFAKSMRYMLPIKALIDARWTDLAWRMQQVKRHSSALRQKPGKLNDWTGFLFGETKLINYKELLKAWGEGNIDLIKQYNLKDLDLTAKLWMLSEFVMTGDPWTPDGSGGEGSSAADRTQASMQAAELAGEYVEGSPTIIDMYMRVVSKNSSAEQWVPPGTTRFRDFVTGKVEDV